MRLVGEFNREIDLATQPMPENPMSLHADDADAEPTVPLDWPGEVDLILSAMEAAAPRKNIDRRASARSSYRTRAHLKLFAEHPLDAPRVLYTRDVQDRGIGFITRERLPLGYGGVVELTMPDGKQVRTHCTVHRCRESINGWFEGALHFTLDRRDH